MLALDAHTLIIGHSLKHIRALLIGQNLLEKQTLLFCKEGFISIPEDYLFHSHFMYIMMKVGMSTLPSLKIQHVQRLMKI